VLLVGVVVAALPFAIYRRSGRPTTRRMTAAQTSTRTTRVDDVPDRSRLEIAENELWTAQQLVADLEMIVEDLIMVIGPGATTLLWNLRATRAEEEPDLENVGLPESLTTQIERLSTRISAFETAAEEATESNPSASTEPAADVAPTGEPRKRASVDPTTGTEDDAPAPETAPDGPAVAEVSLTLCPLYVDPAAREASPVVNLEQDTERPVHVELDYEGSAPGNESRWLRFSLASLHTGSREPSFTVGTFEESPTLRSSFGPEEATAIGTPVLIELHRAEGSQIVVDLSERNRADAIPGRTERLPSSG
jgi:hypothetical protein